MKSKIILQTALAAAIFATACKKDAVVNEPVLSYLEKLASTNLLLNSTVGTNVQEFMQQKSSESERDRLGHQSWLFTDFDPTGFHVAANTTFTITVNQLQGSELPKIIIGTYYLHDNAYNYTPQTVQLQSGVNSITSDSKGGMIWVRYTTSGSPNSKARITFNSGHQRVPIFIKNVTTQTDWNNQLTTYTTPDVLLIGEKVFQVYSRTYAQNIQPQDNSSVLETADKGWDWQNELSGLDGSSPINQLPVHDRVLMVRTNDNSVGAYAYFYGTGYANSTHLQAFTPAIKNDGWGPWHEMGHLRQQYIWTWSNLGEVTNNIFALHVERKLGLYPSRLKKENRYQHALNFIADSDPYKNFNTMTGTYDDHFSRLVMFQQLYLAFGEKFYMDLHKKARLEPRNTSMTDEAKMSWFMKAACQVSGRDLTNFFRKWGFRVNESVYTTISGYGYPNPTIEPYTLTEDNTNTGIINGGIYKITSAINNSSVIDCNSHTPINGTAVTLWSDNGGYNNQKWLARRQSDGSFVLKSMSDTTKVLDVANSSTSTGTLIKMWTYGGGNNQKWDIDYQGNDLFTLTPKHAPMLKLDVNGGFSTNGTTLITWTNSGGVNQKFKFQKLN